MDSLPNATIASTHSESIINKQINSLSEGQVYNFTVL